LNRDVKLIYISTDAVYDGDKGNFSENDNINPQNYYGRTKYEGEVEVARRVDALILRTNFFGWNAQDKKSLAEWILGELKAKRRIDGFKDAYFSSIYTKELAKVIERSIEKDLSGVHNCGSSDSCSKYEFALKIAECFGLDKSLVKPISIEDFEFKAKRGKNLTLKVEKLQNILDYQLPTINHSIQSFYSDYNSGIE
jgi:dTDP-4-dehydrorhamnose reductase